MKIGRAKYIEYIGFIYRVIIYLKEFSAEEWYSGATGSIVFHIKVNSMTKSTISLNYDEGNETDIYLDRLINPIFVKPKDKVEIELEENPPSGISFMINGVEVSLKCSI